MKNPSEWEQDFQIEIQSAQAARERGNEGMARVCARRAAGIVAAQFFLQQGISQPAGSALERLKRLRELPDLPPQVLNLIEHFLMRITPEHRLPIEVDLVAEAGWLRKALIGGSDLE